MALVNAFGALATQPTRRDSESASVTDGNTHPLFTNAVGRLKVSTMPGMVPYTQSTLYAVQALPGTVVTGGSIIVDTSRSSNVVFGMTAGAAFAAMTVVFEVSVDKVTWVACPSVRSVGGAAPESTTGAISALPAYGWEASVNGYNWFQLRCTARTSGTMTWNIQTGAYATEPNVILQSGSTTAVTGSVAVSGTVTVIQSASTPYTINSLATTNSAVVKASAGNLFTVTVTNTTASLLYVKLYNKATAPTIGTDIPIMLLIVPATSTVTYPLGTLGQRFLLGIGIGITGGIADSDTTAVTAGAAKVALSYT